MGMEVLQNNEGQQSAGEEDADGVPLESRPSILLVGAPAVGKTSILNRLRQKRRPAVDSSAGLTCYGWTIDTKYYTANVGIWMARLDQAQESPRVQSLSGHCEALVMIFDLSNDASFECLQRWASRMDFTSFEIVLCVGNKADCMPQHYGHTEYRRRLQKRGESSSDPHPEFLHFGIQRTEGSALLDDAEDEQVFVDEKRHSRVAWCVENGIEYIEACAINEVFDECLSVDGDLQGVSRVQGALSAHMWEGMVMKPLGKLTEAPSEAKPREDFSSDSESNFTIEYELLSNASDEPYSVEDHHENGLVHTEALESDESSLQPDGNTRSLDGNGDAAEQDTRRPAEEQANAEEAPATGDQGAHSSGQNGTVSKEEEDLDEFEHFMQDMAGMRENLRTMPDTQRREIAARLALRMASMFMDGDE